MQKVKKDQGTRVPTTQGPKEETRKVVRATPKDRVETAPKDRGKIRAIRPDVAYLSYSADDTGNAEIMYELYKDRFLYSPALGWLEYTGTHWTEISESPVNMAAMDTLKRRRHSAVDASTKGENVHIAEAIIKVTHGDKQRISSCAFLFRAFVTLEDVTLIDNEPDKLNCLNGVVDLRTGEVTPHSFDQLFTYVVPVNYNPLARSDLWATFLQGSFVYPEVIAYAQKCVGYSFTGIVKEEKLFYIKAARRSGKGTFQNTLLALLSSPMGVKNPLGVSKDFNTFTRKREGNEQNFDLAPLRSMRLVCASESNKYQSLNPAKIKSLTGRDPVDCAHKYGKPFNYLPQFKVWMFSNHPVNADVDDDALWGRVQVFEFPISYFGREDTTLKDRLQEAKHLEGVLAWAVEGAKLWYKEGLGAVPPKVEEWTQNQRNEQDHLKICLEDNGLFREAAFTSYADLRALYKKHCEENGVREIRPQDFTEALVKRFGLKAHRQGVDRIRGYLGYYIKKPSDYRKEDAEKDSGTDNHSSNGHTPEGLLQDLEELDVAFSGIEGL